MATPRLGLVVEDKPTELSCMCIYILHHLYAACTHKSSEGSYSTTISKCMGNHPGALLRHTYIYSSL